MNEAPGKSARLMHTEDFKTYQSAMAALAKVEMDVIFGVDANRPVLVRYFPIQTISNPDFHDGQVIIDKNSRTVTLLDFGQALTITNAQRTLGLEILYALNGVKSSDELAKSITRILKMANHQTAQNLSSFEVGTLFSKKDTMDRFISLIGLLAVKGYELPIESVHWVLAVNRQQILGNKIGRPIDSTIKNAVKLHVLKIHPVVTNLLRQTIELKPKNEIRPVPPLCSQLFK